MIFKFYFKCAYFKALSSVYCCQLISFRSIQKAYFRFLVTVKFIQRECLRVKTTNFINFYRRILIHYKKWFFTNRQHKYASICRRSRKMDGRHVTSLRIWEMREWPGKYVETLDGCTRRSSMRWIIRKFENAL